MVIRLTRVIVIRPTKVIVTKPTMPGEIENDE